MIGSHRNSVEQDIPKKQTIMADLIKTKTKLTEKRINKNECSIINKISNKNDNFSFNIFDIIVLFLSIFSIISDLCTDIILVIQYSKQGYKAWAIATFLLIFFPSIVVQFFSLRWHIVDKTASVLHWILHFCMLGIIHRYVQIIQAAIAAYKSKKPSDAEKVFLDQSDLCMLHLFESFLESAPQLVLQMYVIAMIHEWRFWTGMSALASLFSLSWALASYTKAQRRARPNKNSSSYPGLLLQAIWRMGMLTSRISTLVLGAYCFGNYIFILFATHWLAMIIWIIYQKTDLCETYWEERMYNAVVGVIYCFCFFNLQEGQSRWRVLAFYLVVVFQNLTCLTIFLTQFADKTPKLAISGFIAIVGGTVLGTLSMLVYYRFFHPSGPIKFLLSSKNIHINSDSPSYPTLTLRSLKRTKSESHSDASQKSTPQSDSKNLINDQAPFSDSIVIIEESISDTTDPDIKMLQDWINDNKVNSVKPPIQKEMEKNEVAFKRRAICSSVDLAKMIDSETGSLKMASTDEASSEILSAHDYENLAAVNIAREAWGLRSWRGYSDIETWLHDDSVVHDRRLDTLTSTTSSDRSANTLQKESDRTRQDDYIDVIAEDLAECESEGNSDGFGQYSIESLPVIYPLHPIFEEIEESSTSTEATDLKNNNGSASTLVATIDEIRRNTPTQNRFLKTESIYDDFSNKKPFQGNWKKVTFASKLLTYLEESVDQSINSELEEEERDRTGISSPLKEEAVVTTNQKINALGEEINISSRIEVKKTSESCNKENIPVILNKINWNKVLSLQDGWAKKISGKEGRHLFLKKVLSPPNFSSFQASREN